MGYPLIIYDTLGFEDTISMDLAIQQQIYTFLKDNCSKLHAICFVINSQVNRIHPDLKLIADNLISLFNKSFKNNILTMFTFADSNEPLAKEAVKYANIPHNEQ